MRLVPILVAAALAFAVAACGGGGGSSSGGSGSSSSGGSTSSSSGGSSTSSSSGGSSTSSSGGGGSAQLPTLPQTTIDTTYSAPTGSTITVSTGGNLQAAINNAQPGDTIVLQAGATFTGPFTLPNKTGSGWIHIRSSAYASLPAPGTRVTPANAANMPKIVVGANVGGAITTSSQAHHYRFVGIEFAPVAGQFVYNLVNIGNAETSVASLPHDITFDRCYIHGDPTVGGRRGVAMNGASVAVVDSYVSDFKETGADTQALWTYNSPGPLKIVNNYLEAAGENFMSGGADPAIQSLIPSDIEIRHNHFFKPLAWMGSSWTVKNLLEFKNAQRILVEGNTFENIWAAAQSGAMIIAKSTNQDGSCAWCVTQHLTVRNNRGINLEEGFHVGGGEGQAVAANHILIEHNVLEITRPNGGRGWIFLIVSGNTGSGSNVGGPVDTTIRHNTALILVAGGTAAFIESDPKTDRFDFRDNLLSNGEYGFAGTGTGTGTNALNTYISNYTFTHNAFIGGGPAGSYPANNFFPASNAATGFVDFTGGNYALSSTSSYHNAASDGTDIGANITQVTNAVQ